MSVPPALAFTRPSLNDESAEPLPGVRPSFARVRDVVRIAVNWATVVPDLAWMARTSVWRVWSAVLSAVLDDVELVPVVAFARLRAVATVDPADELLKT